MISKKNDWVLFVLDHKRKSNNVAWGENIWLREKKMMDFEKLSPI